MQHRANPVFVSGLSALTFRGGRTRQSSTGLSEAIQGLFHFGKLGPGVAAPDGLLFLAEGYEQAAQKQPDNYQNDGYFHQGESTLALDCFFQLHLDPSTVFFMSGRSGRIPFLL